jgi:hypothetical protein
MLASIEGHSELVKELLKRGVDPDKVGTWDAYTALMLASQEGHLEVAKELLDGGADPNKTPEVKRCTALMLASQEGHLGVVKELLKRGAAINTAATTDGATALVAASQNGWLEVAQHLVISGANISAKPKQCHRYGSWDARAFAASAGHHTIVDWFDTVRGWSTFWMAVSLMLPVEIKALLRRGVVDPDDCAGSSAAVAAAATSELHQEMPKLVRQSVGGWSLHSHWLHKCAVRLAVATTLTVGIHLDRLSSSQLSGGAMVVATATVVAGEAAHASRADAARPSLPLLPPEIWEAILYFLSRRHW